MKTVYLIFMSLSVFILTSVLFIKQNTSVIFGTEADFRTVSISVDKSFSSDEITALLAKITEIGPQLILDVKLITSKDQLLDVQAALPTFSQGLFEDDDFNQILNPIIEVQIADVLRSDEIISRIQSFAGASEVTFGNAWVEKIKSLFETLNIILNTVFIMFFIVLSFLIAILIRNYLINAKESISLQALLGASPQQSFIKHYISIMTRTLAAYGIGIVCSAVLALVIKQKLGTSLQLSFIGERLTLLNSTNTIIILGGLILNLLVSYILSYQYVLREFYQHD